jgi:SSS family solute:Na+ symporter
MIHIALIDTVVIVVYLILMMLVGFYFSKKIKSSTDFYIAGRSLGMFTVTATVCATMIGGGALVGRGGVMYAQGAVGIWLALPYFIGMIFFSMISGRIHKIGVKYDIISIPDLMERRYGKTAKILVASLVAFTMMATVGAQISATATILKIVGMQWGITYQTGALIATIIFIVYTSASGLYGVVYTDVIQFIVLILSVYIAVPIIALFKVGGVGQLVNAIPSDMWNLKPDATIVGYIFTNLVFTLAGAEIWQRAFASKNARVAQRGTLFGTLIYGLTIISTFIIALCAVVIIPDLFEVYGTYDAAVPALVLKTLPVGLVGITIAGLLSVLMSSSDSYLLISTQTITNDIIRTLKEDITDKQIILLSRIIIPMLGFLALIIALYIKSAYAALMFAWTFYASSVGLPAFAALYWKKATKYAVVLSVITGFVSSCAWELAGRPFGIASSIVGSVLCGIVLYTVGILTYKKGEGIFLDV